MSRHYRRTRGSRKLRRCFEGLNRLSAIKNAATRLRPTHNDTKFADSIQSDEVPETPLDHRRDIPRAKLQERPRREQRLRGECPKVSWRSGRRSFPPHLNQHEAPRPEDITALPTFGVARRKPATSLGHLPFDESDELDLLFEVRRTGPRHPAFHPTPSR